MTNNGLDKYSSYWSHFQKLVKNTNINNKKCYDYNQEIQNYYLKQGLSLGNLIAQRPLANMPIFKNKTELELLKQSILRQNILSQTQKNNNPIIKNNNNNRQSQLWIEIKNQEWQPRIAYYFLLHYFYQHLETQNQEKKETICNKWKGIVHYLQTDQNHQFITSYDTNNKSTKISISDGKVYFFKFLKILSKNSVNMKTQKSNFKKGHVLKQINLAPKIDPILIYILKESIKQLLQTSKDFSIQNFVDFLKIIGFQKVYYCQQFPKYQKQQFLLKLQVDDFVIKVKNTFEKEKKSKISNLSSPTKSNNFIYFSIENPPLSVSQFYDSQIQSLQCPHLQCRVVFSHQDSKQFFQDKNPQQQTSNLKKSINKQDDFDQFLQHRDTVNEKQFKGSQSKSSIKSPISPFMKRNLNFKKISLNRKETIVSQADTNQLQDSIVVYTQGNQIFKNFLGVPQNVELGLKNNSITESNNDEQEDQQDQEQIQMDEPIIKIHFSNEEKNDIQNKLKFKINQDFNYNNTQNQDSQQCQLKRYLTGNSDGFQIQRYMTGNSSLSRFLSNKDTELQRQINKVMISQKQSQTHTQQEKIDQLRNMTFDQRKKQLEAFNEAQQSHQNYNQSFENNNQKGDHPYIGNMQEIQFCKSQEEVKSGKCPTIKNSKQPKSKKSKKNKNKLNKNILDIPNSKNDKKDRKYSEKIQKSESFGFGDQLKNRLKSTAYETPIKIVNQTRLRKLSADTDPLQIQKYLSQNRAKTLKVESLQYNSSDNDKIVSYFQQKYKNQQNKKSSQNVGKNRPQTNYTKNITVNQNIHHLESQIQQKALHQNQVLNNFFNCNIRGPEIRNIQSPNNSLPNINFMQNTNNFGLSSQRISLNSTTNFQNQAPNKILNQSHRMSLNKNQFTLNSQQNNLNNNNFVYNDPIVIQKVSSATVPHEITNHNQFQKLENNDKRKISLNSFQKGNNLNTNFHQKSHQNHYQKIQQIKNRQIFVQQPNRNSLPINSNSSPDYYIPQRNSLSINPNQYQNIYNHHAILNQRNQDAHRVDNNIFNKKYQYQQNTNHSNFIQQDKNRKTPQNNIPFNDLIVSNNTANSKYEFKAKSQIYTGAFNQSHPKSSNNMTTKNFVIINEAYIDNGQKNEKGKISLKVYHNNHIFNNIDYRKNIQMGNNFPSHFNNNNFFQKQNNVKHLSYVSTPSYIPNQSKILNNEIKK